ncbi:hypothetical protein CYMTET_24790 [Cymbomonas tetramitiformis]|uniref:Uncharacterized protein n=1 Tax=Cymbomonas tetramitiformis TaxID=36881 RepID=A0AAE0FV63_9CHLO|nr:hypothetical protein CYMTET_24790 [Cymbomonas tetramitiformis]
MRYYYQGTAFDQTATLAGGPYGMPDRFAGSLEVEGSWERTIGLYRTSDSYIVQSRSWLPNAVGGVLWFGSHAAPYTTYVPYLAGMQSLPAVTLGYQAEADKGTFFWAHRYMAQLVRNDWRRMMPDLDSARATWHNASLAMLAEVESKVTPRSAVSRRHLLQEEGLSHYITSACSKHAQALLKEAWSLYDALQFKYADGWLNEVSANGEFSSTSVQYPAWWLRAVNYSGGPGPVPPRPHEQKCAAGRVKDCTEKCSAHTDNYVACVSQCTEGC